MLDREYRDLLAVAERLYLSGADALIVADLGAARLLHEMIPKLPLHASTQCSVHNTDGAKMLQRLGFVRLVPARELSIYDIRQMTAASPLETEIFIHGALCVSHSGQCLFSSLVGGRSGNRGECAQPCRMRYSLSSDAERAPDGYPLSLKDLCLASHITEILESGVDSLKIEGRMKSPHYVGEVTRIYRRLLDERRNATPDEIAQLDEIFSRQGFTDAYFTSRTPSVSLSPSYMKMTGIRTDTQRSLTQSRLMQRADTTPRSQKQAQSATVADLGRESEVVLTSNRRRQISLELSLGQEAQDCFVRASAYDSACSKPVCTTEIPLDTPAIANDPARALTAEDVKKSFSRLGGTPFVLKDGEDSVRVTIKSPVFMPTSQLNGARRSVLCELEQMLCALPSRDGRPSAEELLRLRSFGGSDEKGAERLAVFTRQNQLTSAAQTYFGLRFLSFEALAELSASPDAEKILRRFNGIALPPVILDSEREKAEQLLELALSCDSITHALASNPGQLPWLIGRGLHICLDLRFNVGSAQTVASLATIFDSYGALDLLRSVTLSPELTLAQLRDVIRDTERAMPSVTVRALTYGRVPLMTLERCIMRQRLLRGKGPARNDDCRLCASARLTLTDRTGAHFPVIRLWQHRNAVLNSVPTVMTDKALQLERAGIRHEHIIFTVESPAEVDAFIEAHESHTALDGGVRRIRP